MSSPEIDPRILEIAEQVSAKRPKTVIDHLINHGSITTEELHDLYGYDHPPRAIRDVRETGIPIETFRIISSRTGRSIAAYRFGNPEDIRQGRHLGRRAFPADFKDKLIEEYGQRDHITGQPVPARQLQIDHRVPYEVAGETATELEVSDFMLLDASMQRTKAFTCSECPNMLNTKDPEVCASCYWAYPEDYIHVATTPIRRADITWQGEEIDDHDEIVTRSLESGVSVSTFIKSAIRRLLKRDK